MGGGDRDGDGEDSASSGSEEIPVVVEKGPVFEDNILVWELLEARGEGRVLIIDGGGSLRCALVDGNMIQSHPTQLTEWINTGGVVSANTAATASEECEKFLRMGDWVGLATYDKKRLLLYAMISDSRRALLTTKEDFLWFKLLTIREFPLGGSFAIFSESSVPYSLEDLQAYLNKSAASYHTKNGKDPLVYILLLSIQFLHAILYLSKEARDEGYNIDATHIAIALDDHGVLMEGTGAGSKFGVMDAYAEASSMIRQHGYSYLRLGDLSVALEYFAQAAAAIINRQRSLMLKQLLTELLLRDGGIYFLLGSRGSGEEGELTRLILDVKTRQQFMLEAAQQCLEAGIYDKVWPFSPIESSMVLIPFSFAYSFLISINTCLSDSTCKAGLIHSGNKILETYKYSLEISSQFLQ
ncbi:hypothetical protein ACJRO7_020288, partial [Eucalyptus globulus]